MQARSAPLTARARAAALRWLPLASLLAVSACALAPLQPDLTAKAPKLEGFGESQFSITTRSPEAQRLFHAGVLQAYAFNEAEAVRQFKAALAADPACAMCAWGVAWQLGPNINNPARGDMTAHRQYIVHAQRHAASVSPREQALIGAMAARYGESSTDAERVRASGPSADDTCRSATAGTTNAHPLDRAYAQRMRAVLLAHPSDPDVLSLWSEAALIEADDWYDERTGQAVPVVAEMVNRLEAAMRLHPRHTGLLHYMIHASDAPANAARAVAASDQLSAVAPQSPHLVHMPSHIFVRVGRYADAASVNARAVSADVAIAKLQTDQGFSVSKDWRGHNTHFLWYAELMQGRGNEALAAARELAKRGSGASPYAQYLRSLPLLTLVRLQRWDAVLSEALPSGEGGISAALSQQARGTALLRLGRAAEARVALAAVQAAHDKVAVDHAGKGFMNDISRQLAGGALASLRGELALTEGRADEAVGQLAQAVTQARKLDEAEPPRLGGSARLALAEAQLRLGRAADAEATARDDLKVQPDSGWALHMLARALAAQGKSAEANAARERAQRAWSHADAALRARAA